MSYDFWIGCSVVFSIIVTVLLVTFEELRLRKSGLSGVSPEKKEK